MHGIYKIKVIDIHNEDIVEYYAPTHPGIGESLFVPSGIKYRVSAVNHHLKNDNNGAKRYIDFSHVELIVY